LHNQSECRLEAVAHPDHAIRVSHRNRRLIRLSYHREDAEISWRESTIEIYVYRNACLLVLGRSFASSLVFWPELKHFLHPWFAWFGCAAPSTNA
jgi:hypothetical protein